MHTVNTQISYHRMISVFTNGFVCSSILRSNVQVDKTELQIRGGIEDN